MQTVLIFEDEVHDMILGKIFEYIGIDINECQKVVSSGKSRIDAGLKRYAGASSTKRVIILRDLDDDAACAPELKSKLLRGVDRTKMNDRNFVFRVAVREAEAWLMADTSHCVKHFKINPAHMNRINVNTVKKPKNKLLMLINAGSLRASKKKLHLVADKDGAVAQAPGYNDAIREYIREWSVDKACRNSESLARAVASIRASFDCV